MNTSISEPCRWAALVGLVALLAALVAPIIGRLMG